MSTPEVLRFDKSVDQQSAEESARWHHHRFVGIDAAARMMSGYEQALPGWRYEPATNCYLPPNFVEPDRGRRAN